jgi:pre-mRNA-processing factor 8
MTSNIDAYQLADGLQNAFNHVGQLTEMYRGCISTHAADPTCRLEALDFTIKLHTGPVGKGPGVGFWGTELARVDVFSRCGITLWSDGWGNLLGSSTGPPFQVVCQECHQAASGIALDLELRK